MIVGTGIDIAEVPRIRQSIERFGQRFLQRIFTASRDALLRFQGEPCGALCRALRRQGSCYEGSGHGLEPRCALARLRSVPHAWRPTDYDIPRQGWRIRCQARREKCRSIDFAHPGTGDRSGHSRELDAHHATARAKSAAPLSARLSPSNSFMPVLTSTPIPTSSSTEIPEKTLLAGLALTSFCGPVAGTGADPPVLGCAVLSLRFSRNFDRSARAWAQEECSPTC